MKSKFIIAISILLTISTLLFVGCSKVGGNSNNSKKGDSIHQSTNTSSTNKSPKTITDNDLMNSVNEDSAVQLDSTDVQSQQFNSDEIDSLLNDNSDLNNIPANFSVK